jgi:hypothetical protein
MGVYTFRYGTVCQRLPEPARSEITEIVSFDRGFDAVAGINRLPALDSSRD